MLTTGVRHGTKARRETIRRVAKQVTGPEDVAYINAQINTALEKDIKGVGLKSPDITIVGKDQTVTLIEV